MAKATTLHRFCLHRGALRIETARKIRLIGNMIAFAQYPTPSVNPSTTKLSSFASRRSRNNRAAAK